MSGVPRVSVIVVSYNRARDLRRSLGAIFATGYPALEVIVVDNASRDDAADVAASFPEVKVIRSAENLGLAGGNNVGVAHATGEYVALISDDAVIEPTWIADFVSFLETHPDAAAVGGKQYLGIDDDSPGMRTLHYSGYSVLEPNGDTSVCLDCPDDVREVVTLSGPAVMIRRRAIEEVGEPFLEPIFFMHYEQADFFARTLRCGYRLYYWGRPACWHLGREEAEERYSYHYYMNRNRLIFAYRHLDDAELDRVIRDLRKRVLFARAKRPLSFLIEEKNEARAAREAWAWATNHRALLLEHRARHSKVGGSYSALVRKIQDRAGYDHERSEIAALVPAESRCVIDVGCASGGLGQNIKRRRPEIEVRGIEPVPIEADRARAVLDDVLVGEADVEALPADWPQPDCVIFADLLEHLTDPWSTLQKWRERLVPGGALVVSIPNVLHHRVISGLVRGHWNSTESGILDRTYLRSFTRATASELVESAGFRIERIERVIHMPGPASVAAALKAGIRRTREAELETGRLERTWRTTLSDLCTLRYLILARADGGARRGEQGA
jgi:GT2 family glycosyltransferase/SAM-dependent methyltransferase